VNILHYYLKLLNSQVVERKKLSTIVIAVVSYAMLDIDVFQ